MMLPTHIEFRDIDGATAVEVTLELTAAQAAAAAHALRVVRDVRYRTADDLTVDDILAMRELTAVTDDLDAAAGTGLASPVRLTVARTGLLAGALSQFAADEHQEREGDADHRGIVFSLVDDVADVHAQAVAAALSGPAPAPAI